LFYLYIIHNDDLFLIKKKIFILSIYITNILCNIKKTYKVHILSNFLLLYFVKNTLM